MNATENKLWACIQREELGGHKFTRQHAISHYIADIACISQKLIVELEGPPHKPYEPSACDTQRTQYLLAQGWTILRYTNEDIYRSLDSVIDDIYAHLKGAAIIKK